MSGAPVPVPTPVDKAFFDRLVDFVVAAYGHYSGRRLSEMTHGPGNPWGKTRLDNPGIENPGIDQFRMLEYFAKSVEFKDMAAVDEPRA